MMTQMVDPDPLFPDSFQIPAETVVPADTEIAILRSLGRFEMMFQSWVELLHFPPLTSGVARSRTTHRALQALRDLGLIWRVSTAVGKRSLRGRNAYVYGLTRDGQEYLDLHGQEPDPETLRRLKWRPKHNPNVGTATLAHDLKAAAWCVGMTHALRQSSRLHQLFVQVEYTTDNQRFDALVMARFWKHPPQKNVFLDRVPWWEAADIATGLVDVIAFALEIDQGTEATRIIREKAETYRDLALSGLYQNQIGTSVIPVFLVPDQRRMLAIMAMWNGAWKGVGESDRRLHSAVISTAEGAVAQTGGTQFWGPLWGTYLDIATNQRRPLLGSLGCTSVALWEDQWATHAH